MDGFVNTRLNSMSDQKIDLRRDSYIDTLVNVLGKYSKDEITHFMMVTDQNGGCSSFLKTLSEHRSRPFQYYIDQVIKKIRFNRATPNDIEFYMR